MKNQKSHSKTPIEFPLGEWREEMRGSKLTDGSPDVERMIKIAEIAMTSGLKAVLDGKGESVKIPKEITKSNKRYRSFNLGMEAVGTVFTQRVIAVARALNLMAEKGEAEVPAKPKLKV